MEIIEFLTTHFELYLIGLLIMIVILLIMIFIRNNTADDQTQAILHKQTFKLDELNNNLEEIGNIVHRIEKDISTSGD